MKHISVFTLLLFTSALSTSLAQNQGCEVPDNMTKDQKLPCIRAGSMMLDQPTLTPTQIQNGPDFDPARPEANRYLYFTADDTIGCYFRPHYAFSKVPGDSMKYQCWHMTPQGGFYSNKGDVIKVDAVKVVIEKDKYGEKSASLFPKDDTNNQREMKVDHFKIKYLKPPFPGHNPRFNEVFTGVATTRSTVPAAAQSGTCPSSSVSIPHCRSSSNRPQRCENSSREAMTCSRAASLSGESGSFFSSAFSPLCRRSARQLFSCTCCCAALT